MSKAAVPAFALLCALILDAQRDYTRRKVPETKPPACAPAAICFSGEVSANQEFHKTLNVDLEFVLSPGWTITIRPNRPEGDCDEMASVVNAPYRAHRDLNIDTSYGWKAEWEVSSLGTSRLGTGRLWITNSKITHADDTSEDQLGKIEWMKFSVEITLPR
jgi:hypothetical protein